LFSLFYNAVYVFFDFLGIIGCFWNSTFFKNLDSVNFYAIEFKRTVLDDFGLLLSDPEDDTYFDLDEFNEFVWLLTPIDWLWFLTRLLCRNDLLLSGTFFYYFDPKIFSSILNWEVEWALSIFEVGLVFKLFGCLIFFESMRENICWDFSDEILLFLLLLLLFLRSCRLS